MFLFCHQILPVTVIVYDGNVRDIVYETQSTQFSIRGNRPTRCGQPEKKNVKNMINQKQHARQAKRDK